jgi:hypothetical protein
MSTAAQPLATQQPPPPQPQWDVLGEARKRYSGLQNEDDQSIIEHFSKPENFRAAFPEFAHLSDEDITGNMAQYAKPAGVQQGKPLAGPTGPTTISAFSPSWWDRIKSVFTEGNPNYSSRTVYDPKFDQMQLVTPEAAMTPAEQQRHPIATGLGEVAGGMTSPQNVAMMAASGGLGSLPGAARAIIPRLVSAGFTAQMLKGAYDEYPQFKEALDRGDASEAERIFTHLVATGAMAALSGQHAVKGEAPADISSQTAKPFTRPVAAAIEKTGEVASKAVQTVREIGEAEPHDNMIRALKPPKRAGDAADKINLAGQDVQAMAQTLGKPVKTIDDVLEMSHEAKKSVWKEYEDQLGGNKKASLDGNKIADAMVSSIDARTRTQNPGLVTKIEKIADTYRKPMDLETAEDFLQSANNELDSFYKLNKVGRDAARKSPTMGYKVAEAEALRDGLYDTLDKLTGGNAREIKQRYGALSDLQRWALERKPVYERHQPIGLIESAGRLAGAGQIARGVATAHLGRIAAGLATAAEAKMLRDANDTNNLIDKAFNGPKAFQARAAGPAPTPPAPTPERVLKTGPGGSPPAVPEAFRMEPTGRAEGPTELGRRGGKGVFAPKQLPAPREISTIPPAVPSAFRTEPIGEPAGADRLGIRGKGGVRQPGVKGLLPAPADTSSPAVPLKHRFEATGTVADATKLGPRGQAGIREQRLLPASSSASPEPQYAYRVRDAGEEGISSQGHAQASTSEEDVRRIAPSRSQGDQEVVRVDLSKLNPEDFQRIERQGGAPWVKFHRNIEENEVEKMGPVTDLDRRAADKADPSLRGAIEKMSAAEAARRAGLRVDQAKKAIDDVKADGVHELSPEAVQLKRAVLKGKSSPFR